MNDDVKKSLGAAKKSPSKDTFTACMVNAAAEADEIEVKLSALSSVTENLLSSLALSQQDRREIHVDVLRILKDRLPEFWTDCLMMANTEPSFAKILNIGD